MLSFKKYVSEKIEIPPKSQTKGVDRKDMPQIDSKHTKDFISYLKDKGISTKQVTVDPNRLKATQHQFHKEKVQSLVDYIENGKYDDKPILVSKDYRVMDGHHRWLAHKNTNKNIKIHHVNANSSDMIDMMHEYPKSYTKKLYEHLLVESKSFRGTVYHGSGSRFSKFEQSKARLVNDFYGGGVAYFTNSIKIAITYAKSMSKKTKGDPLVYTVSLNLSKMFDVDDKFTGKDLVEILPDDLEGFARGAGLMGLNSDKFQVMAKLKTGKFILTGDQVFKGLSKGMNTTAKAREHLIAKGYDGLRYNMGSDSVYLSYDASDITIKKRQKVGTNK